MAKLTLYTDQGAEYSISSSNEDLTNLGYGTFTSCQSQGGRWIVYKNTQYNRPDSSRTVENQPSDIQVVSPGPLMVLNPITSAYLIPDSRETAIFFYDNYYGGPRQDSSTSIFDVKRSRSSASADRIHFAFSSIWLLPTAFLPL